MLLEMLFEFTENHEVSDCWKSCVVSIRDC